MYGSVEERRNKMEKKKKQMLLLLAVFALLLVLLFVMKMMNQKQADKLAQEKEAARIFVTDMEHISKISYQLDDEQMTFEQKDGVWTYVPDTDFPLDSYYPDLIADAFGNMEAVRELEEVDDAADYGMDQPAYTVELTDDELGEETLYFGDASGEDYYLMVKSTGKIYTVSSDMLKYFDHKLEDMADLDDYPSIGSGNLLKEKIIKNGETITYDSENEDDAENIAAVAGGLGATTLSEVADYSVEETDLAGYGLDQETRTTVNVTYSDDGEEKEMTLYIGKENGEDSRYVMINDSKIVYLIGTEICSNILNEE